MWMSLKMMFGALLVILLLAAQPLPELPATTEDAEQAGTTAWLFDLEALQAENPLTDDEVKAFRDQAMEALRLQDCDVLQLEAVNPATDGEIPVRLDQQERTLRLYSYSLRSEDFVVLVPDKKRVLVAEAPPAPSTYRGRIDEDPGSQVAASASEGQLRALILGSDGKQWAIEPLRPAVPSAPESLHVVYRAADVIGGEETCGVIEDMVIRPEDDGNAKESVPNGPAGPRGVQGRTQIAFDADFEFFQQNGGSVTKTVRDIEMVMNQVGLIYQNQVGICYAITGMIVRTAEPDPYTASSASNLLCEFRTEWNFIPAGTRDVAHLMTGRDLTGNTVGLAWSGVICNVSGNPVGCLPANDNMAYALSESMYMENDAPPGSTTLAQRVNLTAHEVGHNWNACHCDQMCCTGGGPDADCGIMNSAVTGSLTFGSRAVTAITAHRDSRTCLGTCYDPTYVDLNAVLPGNGSIALPFQTVENGVTYAIVGGEIIIFSGTYPENLTINKQVTLSATGGTVTIGN